MLCHFATRFPTFVADFLSRSRLMRRRFREETITDLMMGTLVTSGAGRVIVDFPNEPVTGADMEWNFVNPADGTFFRILLQAKRAYGEGSVWARHSYRQLFHTTGSGSKPQAEILCDTARQAKTATYPLYVFYNPQQTCTLAQEGGYPDVVGVTLADGYLIEFLVRTSTTRRLQTRSRRLGKIAPHSFPLATLFCPPSVLHERPFVESGMGQPVFGAPAPPTPRELRDRLVRRRPQFGGFASAGLVSDIPDIPDVAETIPEDVQAVVNRRFKSDVRGPPEQLDRWRVTFVSGSEMS